MVIVTCESLSVPDDQRFPIWKKNDKSKIKLNFLVPLLNNFNKLGYCVMIKITLEKWEQFFLLRSIKEISYIKKRTLSSQQQLYNKVI